MSVGLQRLRDEPDVDPPGRRSTRARTRRSSIARSSWTRAAGELLGEGEALKAERNTRVEADRRGDQGRRRAGRPRGRRAAGRRRSPPASGSTALDAELAEVEAEVEDAPPAHPQPGRPGRAGRRRGGQRHGPHLGRAAPARGTARRRGRRRRAGRRRDVDAQAALGDRRGARHHRQRAAAPRSPARASPSTSGAGSALQRALIKLVPRRPHARERLHRGLAAGRRQHRVGARHRPDPGQGRPDVRRHPRRAVPGPDGRGPGHQPPPRRDPRGGRPADPLRRLHAVLPARGGRGRQGHPRDPARPPVRQGRDGPVRAARRTRRQRSSG